jgi:hypothetical protein
MGSSSRNLNAGMGPTGDEFPEVGIQEPLHDDETSGVDQPKNAEQLPTAGAAQLKKEAMRTRLETELKKELDNMHELIIATYDKIWKLETEHNAEIRKLNEVICATNRKKKYAAFAYHCFESYSSTGTLSWTLDDDSNSEMYEEIFSYDRPDLREELLTSCIAKYGFVFIKCKGRGGYLDKSLLFFESFELQLGIATK